MKKGNLHFLLILVTMMAVVAIPSFRVSSAQSPALMDVRGFSAALGPDGVLWAVWSADDGHDTNLFYSRWTGDGWQQARPVYTNPVTWDDFPSLALAADGTPWVVWSSADREQGNLYVSRWVGYRWSTPEHVPVDPASRPRQPALAAAPNGGFWLAWIGFDGNDDEIYVAHWDGLTWSAPERVGQDDTDPLAYDTHPRLAVDGNGYPWLVWVSSQGLFDDAVVASRWNGVEWSPEQSVSAPDGTPDVWPSLALDGDGQPWVAWQDTTGTDAAARWRVYAARWQADAVNWGAEELVSSPADLPVEETQPSLGFDADGRPHLAWAVSGELAGVAYATWEGAAWTQPAWAAKQVMAEAPILLPTESPWLLWTDLNAVGQVPLAKGEWTGPLEPLPHTLPQSIIAPEAQAIYNRYVAWGDSITWGGYDDPLYSGDPVGAYPKRLEDKLDSRVIASEVINRGIPSEKVNALKGRIGNEALTYLPQFPLIMEGTNDVTHGHSPSEVAADLSIIIDILKKHVDIDGIRPWLSTLPPRLDGFNGETATMNSYIVGVAAARGVPYADTWQAFYDYGDWGDLFVDKFHPNRAGMQVLADNWYTSVLNEYSWLYEDITPPTTWVEPLSSQTGCGEVLVEWNGMDNVSWVEEYDVQYRVNSGSWTDWLLATRDTSGTFTGGSYGDTVGFQVRGRDAAGNQSTYGGAQYTTISDKDPPYDVRMGSLPTAQKAPILVRWSGADACSSVTFDVEYSAGLPLDWQPWRSGVSYTSDLFDPQPPEYGQTYYFHVNAHDEAGNESGWSTSASTILARFSLEGSVLTIRHELVAGASVSLNPAALYIERPPGHYVVYLADVDDYDLIAERDGFGTLPPMHLMSVMNDATGLDLVLPPLDNVILDGNLEPGAWDDWQAGGTFTPSVTTEAHTGYGAALLGGTGELSWLSQALSVPDDLTDATLSFLVRLDDDSVVSSTLHVELEGTPISHTQVVPAGGWTHVWLPVDAALGQEATLTFTVSDAPAVRLDEVSLGSAISGGGFVYLPITLRGYGQ